jgi:hypothetical protein
VRRIPLLSGTRLAHADVPDGGVVLRAPPPVVPIGDVGAAVREALRYPLAGEPLEKLVTRGGTATVVIEIPTLPIPPASPEPRHESIAATVDELDRLGVERVTILVAGGLLRRPSAREIGLLVPPTFRRRFRGRVIVHDVEADDLVDLGSAGPLPLRVSRALVETDLVVSVTAAETVLHGGPAALGRACGREAARAAGAVSLLEPASSQGWDVALELERRLASRTPVFGVSLALNLPRFSGTFPAEEQVLEWFAGSRLRRLLGVLPDDARRRMIERVPRELTAAAVFGGTPSVAHTEALLRAIEFRSTSLAEPLDAIVIGIPSTTLFLPRAQANPAIVAYLGLGLALRLWRNAFPVRSGGTAILVHDLRRRFPAPAQNPYRALFADPRTARDREAIGEAERAAADDDSAIADYRAGRAVHPLEPFLGWSACDAVASRLGNVLVAGCRDAQSARQLGFVPVGSVAAALAMAEGSGAESIGFVPSPPYFPLVVG